MRRASFLLGRPDSGNGVWHWAFKLQQLIMFYDLNVPYSPGDHEISATLSFLAERTSLFF
jgi:hypothetical protein